MLEETVQISKAEKDFIWIKVEAGNSCKQCASSGCQTKVISPLFAGKSSYLQLNNYLACKVGDKVVIGIPDSLLVRSAMTVYLLPLIMMIIFTVFANKTGFSDELQSLIALFSLGGGFFLIHLFKRKKSHLPSEVFLLRKATN